MAVTVAAAAALVAAATGSGVAQAVVAGPVSSVAATFTPSIADSGTDGSVEQVRQIVQCGSTMYAVGRFTHIKQGGVTYARSNVVSFSASTGVLTGWNPKPNGTVDAIALSADCSTAYLGGAFTTVGGQSKPYLSAVTTTTGAVRTAFSPAPNKRVTTVEAVGAHLLVGGSFTTLKGVGTHRYLASVNPSTGSDDGYVNLPVSGTYVYTDQGGRHSAANSTRVYNFTLSPNRSKLLAMGVFTSVAGHARRQVFMADLGAAHATVDAWTSPEFAINCAVGEPFWLKAASWSTDGATVYTATTGYKPASGPAYSTTAPRQGLCDSAAAFPSTAGPVTHRWINYTGCDSLYATAADGSAAYFGGHERWASNPAQCDDNTKGTAVNAPGMVGLSPSTGAVVANPTRDRGYGADDMLLTTAGLWIASDNAYGSNACGKTSTGARATGHAGICLLPR